MSKLNDIVIAIAALLFLYFRCSVGQFSPENEDSYLLELLRNSFLQDAPRFQVGLLF